MEDMLLSRVVTVALCLGLLGCQHLRPIGSNDDGAGSAAAVYPKNPATDPGFRFGVGDQLEVRVYREPELSGTYMVGPYGHIQFPLAGPVLAGGLTATEVANNVTKALAGTYLKNPQVAVLLKEVQSRKVSVLGQVDQPGTFTYQESMTIVEAVSKAGGFTKLAERRRVKVTRIRNGAEQTFVVDLDRILEGRAQNLVLEAGDVVFIPESLF